MITLELLKTTNEHKTNNFVDKGEDTPLLAVVADRDLFSSINKEDLRVAALDAINCVILTTQAKEPERLRRREEERKRKQEEQERIQAEIDRQREIEVANQFVIYDDVDESGNGSYVYFDKKNKQFVVEISDECGYAGGTWFIKLDELKKHIDAFESYLDRNRFDLKGK